MIGVGGRPATAPDAAFAGVEPGTAEHDELMELQQMFSSRGPYPPPRDSTIPKTTLAKLKVGEELLLHADEARQEREDRRRVREAQMAERLARAQMRREEAKQRQDRCRAAREKEHQRKMEIVRNVKADEDVWERERQTNQAQLYETARQRVEVAAGPYKNLDARLDAQEEAQDKAERDEATREKQRLTKALEQMHSLNMQERRAGAVSSRERRSKALEKAAKQQALLKRLAADEKRAESRAWLLARQHNESLLLSKARDFKEEVAKSRQNARDAQEAQLARKKIAAMKERANDVLVEQEKARILANNKELVAYTYRSKFASQREAEEWGASTLLQFRSDFFGGAMGAGMLTSSGMLEFAQMEPGMEPLSPPPQ